MLGTFWIPGSEETLTQAWWFCLLGQQRVRNVHGDLAPKQLTSALSLLVGLPLLPRPPGTPPGQLSTRGPGRLCRGRGCHFAARRCG